MNRVEWQGSRSVFVALASLGCLIVLSGCASSQDSLFELQDEHYRPMIERQKAGLPFDESVSKMDVKEYTSEEYEQFGDSHMKQGKIVLAAVQYEASLKMEPDRIPVRYKAAQVYLQHGKAEKAYERFHEILDYDFNYALAYEGMGQALLRMNKDAEAELEFQQALTFDSQLWRAHNFLGIIADRQARHATAMVHYQKALAISANNFHVLNNLGMAYFLNKEYEKAINVFQQVVRADSKNSKVWNNLGLTYAKVGLYSESYNAFQRGLDTPKAYNNLGLLFLEEKQTARAVKCFEKAVNSQTTFYEKAQENLTLAKQELSKLSSFKRRAVTLQQGSCL
ncbi:tetratricopeptide repeat protein [Nitrospira sp. M1]